MGNRLKDRVAVVTGSGRGMGKSIAVAMAREGAKVVTNDRSGLSEQTAQEIVDEGGKAIAFIGDISKFDVAQKLVQSAVDNFGRLDILVNNAGILQPKWFWELTEEDWDSVIAVSLKGSFNCCRHACLHMKEQKWGRIISVTSANAVFGALETAHYGAAKGGVISLTKALARELGPFGITCNTYAPFARTQMTIGENAKARFQKRYEGGVITKERYEYMINPPPPENIAPMIVYLATDEASDINGQIFRIDGNRIGIISEQREINPISKPEGLWTMEELSDLVPKVVLRDYHNPAPYA